MYDEHMKSELSNKRRYIVDVQLALDWIKVSSLKRCQVMNKSLARVILLRSNLLAKIGISGSL